MGGSGQRRFKISIAVGWVVFCCEMTIIHLEWSQCCSWDTWEFLPTFPTCFPLIRGTTRGPWNYNTFIPHPTAFRFLCFTLWSCPSIVPSPPLCISEPYLSFWNNKDYHVGCLCSKIHFTGCSCNLLQYRQPVSPLRYCGAVIYICRWKTFIVCLSASSVILIDFPPPFAQKNSNVSLIWHWAFSNMYTRLWKWEQKGLHALLRALNRGVLCKR